MPHRLGLKPPTLKPCLIRIFLFFHFPFLPVSFGDKHVDDSKGDDLFYVGTNPLPFQQFHSLSRVIHSIHAAKSILTCEIRTNVGERDVRTRLQTIIEPDMRHVTCLTVNHPTHMSFIKPNCSSVRNISIISECPSAIHFRMEKIEFLKFVPGAHYNIQQQCIKREEITKEESLIVHLK